MRSRGVNRDQEGSREVKRGKGRVKKGQVGSNEVIWDKMRSNDFR